MILVKTFYAHNDLRNFSYIILDQATGNSWVIDPFDGAPLAEYIRKNGLVLKGILNTHNHWDHVRGNDLLKESFNAPVRNLMNAESVFLGTSHSLETLDTPGHTMDHKVFIWKDSEKPLAVFAGDTLFNSGVGNCKNGGDVNLLFDTTEKLNQLPDSVLLYPGHDYRKRNLEFALSVEPENNVVKETLKEMSTVHTYDLPAATLGQEREVNPFLRLGSLSETNKRSYFTTLRNKRDQW